MTHLSDLRDPIRLALIPLLLGNLLLLGGCVATTAKPVTSDASSTGTSIAGRFDWVFSTSTGDQTDDYIAESSIGLKRLDERESVPTTAFINYGDVVRIPLENGEFFAEVAPGRYALVDLYRKQNLFVYALTSFVKGTASGTFVVDVLPEQVNYLGHITARFGPERVDLTVEDVSTEYLPYLKTKVGPGTPVNTELVTPVPFD